MNTYSVRCLFRWSSRPTERCKFLYEERICIWDAECIDSAIERAEREATEYASSQNAEYLHFAQAYHLFVSVDADGKEIYSLLRESDLDAPDYIDHFFDSGTEREQKEAEQGAAANP